MLKVVVVLGVVFGLIGWKLMDIANTVGSAEVARIAGLFEAAGL